ncbi:MAG: doxx family protein [Frankiales bacterium]|nr:doxx family protein [Frankiales bacterium]
MSTVQAAPAHSPLSIGKTSGEQTGAARLVAAAARILLGWIFLWAFLDKLFGLGHETASAKSWIHGGSPTAGFLGKAAAGPLTGTAHALAGHAWVDWLFMAGLLAIGSALVLGVAMRLAGAAGCLLLVMMWATVLPPANNPVIDDHLIYALLLVMLVLGGAGRTLGLGRRWESLPLVRRYAFLA